MPPKTVIDKKPKATKKIDKKVAKVTKKVAKVVESKKTVKKAKSENEIKEETNQEIALEDIYQKMSQLEHILTRPDTYVGTLNPTDGQLWVYINGKIVLKDIMYCPGLFKIIDEIFVNACDHHKNNETCNVIKVTITKNKITVWNNGPGIPIEIHKKEGVYIPELIFGHLLTSTNYNDKQKRITGGRNGYGAKLTNAFSLWYRVITVDGKNKYVQIFTKNMSEKSEPEIQKCKDKSFTEISFEPDFERFGMTEFTDDMIALITRRVYDIAGTHKNITVYLNDEKIIQNTFIKYIDLYEIKNKEKLIYEQIGERWEVAILHAPENGGNVSFVNSINTYKGGSHINYVYDNILAQLTSIFKEKNPKFNFKHYKQNQIKDNIFLFVNSTIENPVFTSQTKEELDMKASTFGSKYAAGTQFIKKIVDTGVFNHILDFGKFKELDTLSKQDNKNKKTNRITGLPKLEDATLAGTKRSAETFLIVTEGDSAKVMALAGRSVIGADKVGIFPLKGKVLNVRDCTIDQRMNNEEINNLKKILGLQENKVYKDKSELRYGAICILADQDFDGYHIKGLIMNLFHHLFPSLIDLNDFVYSMNTPIIKATKLKETKIFYNLSEYLEWKDKVDNYHLWHVKYYKGLGTSTSEEAKEYFKDFFKNIIKYVSLDKELTNTDINLAFNKKLADNRKLWLKNFNSKNVLLNSEKEVTYSKFIHNELIHFSHSDNIRSIANLMDGFKPSIRKIWYAVVKRGLFKKKNELRVAQLAGFVSDVACYHHGEASLQGAIIGSAQDFVGANNINMLIPSGQFGSRNKGGKDAASPRYIHTYANDLALIIFNPSDNPILEEQNDDGIPIEPVNYAPIIPMILANGTIGIGTGYSTNIPSYNPLDLVEQLYNIMDNKTLKSIKPWYRGFKGSIEPDVNKPGSYTVTGCIEKINNKEFRITELPIMTWTQDYKEVLESMLDKNQIANYVSECTDLTVNFTITLNDDIPDDIYTKMKLVSTINTSNMYLYNAEGFITKYLDVNSMIKEFYEYRLEMYKRRKAYEIRKLQHDMDLNKYKMKYIECKLDKKIIVDNVSEDIIIQKFKENGIPEMSIALDGPIEDYNYIWHMDQRSTTRQKVEELRKKIQDKEKELADLMATSEIDIWKRELNLFVTKYNDFIKSYEVLCDEKISGKVVRKAKTITKKK